MAKRKRSTRRRRYGKNPINALALVNPRRRRRSRRKGWRKNPAALALRRRRGGSGGESLASIPWQRIALTSGAAVGSMLASAKVLEMVGDKLPGLDAHPLVPTAYRVGLHVGGGFLLRKHVSREIGEGVMLAGGIIALTDLVTYIRAQSAANNAGAGTGTGAGGQTTQAYRALGASRIERVNGVRGLAAAGAGNRAFN